jgi:hypothetical protein
MSNKQQLAKLKKEYSTLLSNKPIMFASSVEDVDDAYQEKLEWQWALGELKDRIEELEDAQNECELNSLESNLGLEQ